MRIPGIRLPPEWGAEPVPAAHRRLRGRDFFVLWFSLGVGLLVLAAGGLLTRTDFGFGLTLSEAVLVILIGSVVGSAMLALAGHLGTAHGVPTMVGLRAVLGRTGSYVPTALNVLQLIGWAAFEVMVMGEAAARILGQPAGSAAAMGLVLGFAAFCALLAAGGPVAVVRDWLEKFAVWLVIGSSAWVTYVVFARGGFPWGGFSSGAASLLLATDLVIAMPVSWWPLVCDYTRFGTRSRTAAGGTFLGYAVANAWFFLLGAAMIVALGMMDVIASVLALTLGSVALFLILVDETDNGFANIYSGAVSLQNIFPRLRQRPLVAIIAVASAGAGLWLTGVGGLNGAAALAYEGFLLLIGGVFVPLLGVVASDLFLVRGGAYRSEDFADVPRVRWESFVAWVAGAAVYFYLWWTNYGGGVGWPTLAVGLSLPAFGMSLVLQFALAKWVAVSGASAGPSS